MITLIHLSFVGANVPIATIEFGERLTLVRGPSDTGKSFIVDAIDFMLGAQDLKYIPEREGYAEVLLGVRINDNLFTLSRSVTGGAYGLYEGDLRERPLGPPPRTLAHTHNAGNLENLSMWLLDSIGLAGAKLRKNVRNDTDTLSFRNLAHLVIVDETQMQSEVPPALTGRPQSKTKEVSLLKLLLEGDDDSNLIASPASRDERRLKGARLEVVDQLIARQQEQLAGSEDATALRDQLARLSQSITGTTSSIKQITKSRNDVSEALQRDQTRKRLVDVRLAQIAGLRARFGLLQQQYELDLKRLEMILEGGSLLGYFETAACPLCGALAEHQHRENFEAEPAGLIEAARSEEGRTRQLIRDLQSTFQDLDQNEAQLGERGQRLTAQTEILNRQLQDIDRQMRPSREELSTYLEVKTKLEAALGLHSQLADLERLRAQIEDEVVAETAAAATAIGARAIDAFSSRISERLAAWGYEAAVGTRYDRSQQDIYADNQFRSAHGKGVRAILHAAFTIALADYCFDMGLPHPGFAVLDSPLITYRAPGEGDEAGPNRSFGTAFYHDAEENFAGQLIVMENTDPLDALSDLTVDVYFTKIVDVGRYGYFRPLLEN